MAIANEEELLSMMTDFSQTRKALVIAPHPDDEIFGCGGTLSLLRGSGCMVTTIIVTDGALGGGNTDGKLAEIRAEESRAAARLLGLDAPVFWGLPDRGVNYGEVLIGQLIEIILETDADLVFLPSPADWHPDHQAIAFAGAEAVRRLGGKRQVAFFEVSDPLPCPNLVHDISSADEKKRQAMRCFHSQLQEQPYDTRTSGINSFRAFHLGAQVKSAEAFTLLAAADLDKGLAALLDGPLAYRRNLGFAASGGDIPLVSVIIRSMDRPTLTDALDSLALQTYSNIEVVLVNAKGSEHREIEPWCGRFPVRMIGTGEKLYRSRAANMGLDAARGEYLMFLDDDDWIETDHIQKLVDAIRQHPEFKVVYTGVKCVDEGKNPLAKKFDQPFDAPQIVAGNFIPIHAAMFSRSLLELGCRLDESLDIYEDWDFWIQLSRHGDFLHIEGLSAVYRITQQTGFGVNADPALAAPARWAIYKKWLNKLGDQPIMSLMEAVRHNPIKDSQITYLHQAVSERDGQIANLNQAVGWRDGQIANLNQAVAERDVQIANLNQAVAERDVQIANLNQAVAERDGQIANLNQAVGERDGRIESLVSERDVAVRNFSEVRRSSSWKLTAPLRFLGHLVKGNWGLAGNAAREASRRLMRWIPAGVRSFVRRNYARLLSVIGLMPNSSMNHAAIAAIVTQRCILTREELTVDPLSPPMPQAWSAIDISIVTYNSSRWIANFVDSLIDLDYPKSLLTVRFVDNSSTDSSVKDLHAAAQELRTAGFTVEIMQRPNLGYGAGHNTAISKGASPFCLVTNVDATFEPDALRRIVAVALADSEQVAAWELRQKPYEHPKFYDPVTGITNWNSHTCVLLRRSALEQVGCYDKTLFMYGEDVELSYRLRRAGFLLRYCPQAVIWHYTYESANQVKPMQYIGSTFANLYSRLKYGNRIDALAVPTLGLRLLLASEAYPGSRRAVLPSLLKLIAAAPRALLGHRRSEASFPFRTWNYELDREGAFVEQCSIPPNPPLVSVITRTYRGRELYLRQALLSVAHQTYPNIEHIVVEDGGEIMRAVVANISEVTGRAIHFIKLDKLGRSAAGNAGLSAARGRWCLFLDDDDYLFADHVETLVNTLLLQTDAVAAYSLSWEVITDSARLADGEYSEITHGIPPPLRQDFDYEVLKHHNFMPIQSVLFERKLFEERGGFEVDMEALEDWVLWKKYAYDNKFFYVPKVTSIFRTPSDQEKIRQRLNALDLAYPLALARCPSSAQFSKSGDTLNGE